MITKLLNSKKNNYLCTLAIGHKYLNNFKKNILINIFITTAEKMI